MKLLILPAVLTGVFCAIFATAVDLVTDVLNMWMFLVVSFVSGFLGNLFAQIVTGKRDE